MREGRSRGDPASTTDGSRPEENVPGATEHGPGHTASGRDRGGGRRDRTKQASGLAAPSQRLIRGFAATLELRYAIDARIPSDLFRHRSDSRVILAPFHRSLLDPVLIARGFDRRQWSNLVPVRALATQTFRGLRPLKPMIRLLYRIAGVVELPPRRPDHTGSAGGGAGGRDGPDRQDHTSGSRTPDDKLRGLLEALERGEAVAIFPEGHVRRKGIGEAAEFQPGVVHLHRGSGAPVVPIAVGFGPP
ncbi:MAG: 1-acyl-sn-glycerol-3-phosphate acyltransferase, partial [Gemmatimonadota bacterium]